MNLSPHQNFLASLGSVGVRYALIREPEHWNDSGDIDILVQDIEKLSAVLKSWGCLEFSTSNNNRKYLKHDESTGWWTHLDVFSDIRFGEIDAPAGFVDALLASAGTGRDGVSRLHPHDETILLVFHAALDKGDFGQKYMWRLSQADLAQLSERSALYKFLPMPLGKYLKLINEIKSGEITDEDAIKRIKASFPHCGSSGASLLARSVRRLKQLMRGNRAIVFLGPDGAGKSTITESVAGLRWPKIRCQFMGPARADAMNPSFASILAMFDSLRKKYAKGNPVGLLARAAWQIVCYVDFLERLYRHKWFMGSGGVVIFDRYACDMYFRKPTWLNELIFLKFFPKPRFVFLCTGDAEAIHQRKPELSVYQIESTIELYRKKLSQYRINYEEIDTTRNKSYVNIKNVVSYMINNNWLRK